MQRQALQMARLRIDGRKSDTALFQAAMKQLLQGIPGRDRPMHDTQLVHVIHHKHHCPEMICT